MAAAESTVWTWGRAKNYRLGRAFVGTDARVPEKVSGFEGVAVLQAACGGGHTAVVLADGRLFVFGYSQYGQLGLGDRNDMCEATQVFLVAPTNSPVHPSVPSSPSTPNSGSPSIAGARSSPGQPSRSVAVVDVAQVACGRYHTIARTTTGLVFTWGGGKNGRLGHGDEKIRAQPTCVERLLNERANLITAGYHNNLVLTSRGQVWSWGWGAHGQLGLGDTKDRDVPTVIEELTRERVHHLSCGDRHSFAITEEGRVLGWGSNEFGQLGSGKKGDSVLRPKLIEGLVGLKIVGISSGDRHSAAVTNTGAVYTWGCGTDGQCGHGDLRDVARPKLVERLVGKFVIDVKCGHNFTMVRTSMNEVFTWGNNTYGQLGNNGNGKSEIPVKVVISSSARVCKTSCGHFHCIMWMDTSKADVVKKDSTVINRVLRRSNNTTSNSNASNGHQDNESMRQLEDAYDRLTAIVKSYNVKREECRNIVERERAHVIDSRSAFKSPWPDC